MLKEKFQKLNICVIGDLILDEYIYGSIHRISPEAPIPVVDLERRDYRPGGAANVALNLVNMGIKTHLIGVLGEDEHGEILKELLETMLQGKNPGIFLTKDKITTTKTRVIAHNQHVVRIDHEDKIPIDNSLSLQIINNIIELHNAHPLDCVIIQDYEKGMMHPGNIKQLVSLINSLGIKIIVDPKDKNFWEYENVFLMKPNRKEAENALGSGIKMNIKDLISAAQVIEKRLNNEVTLITLSENGVFLKDDTQNLWKPSEIMEVVDVCGAGDAVISIAAAAYCVKMDIESIALLCNKAGAIVCSERGVAAIDLKRLEEEYKIV